MKLVQYYSLMNTNTLWAAFKIEGCCNDHFVGVAKSLDAAQRLCLEDQHRGLIQLASLNSLRVSHGFSTEPHPAIKLNWATDEDGSLYTTDTSTYVRPNSDGYHLVPTPIYT